MPNFCSVQICFYIASALRGFELCTLKVKGLENFRAFAFCLKLPVNGGMLRFSIAFITVYRYIETTDNGDN